GITPRRLAAVTCQPETVWSCGAFNPRFDFAASAPFSSALRFVSASPYAVIMMIGTSGRMAFALGRSSRPLIPGMLMSDRIRMIDTPERGASSRVATLWSERTHDQMQLGVLG